MNDPAALHSGAEAAFALSVRASGESTDPDLWSVLTDALAARLRGACSARRNIPDDQAAEELRRRHAAEARVDLSSVHPSWIVRALRGESPSVVRCVARNASSRVEDLVRREFGLDDRSLELRHEPDPESVWRSLIFWTERLVGGVPEADDPPVVAALSRLGLAKLMRLACEIGRLKLAWSSRAGDPAAELPFNPAIDRYDQRFPAIALHEVEALTGRDARDLASLGLTTASRLLTLVEPIRARWALQHLPYSLAKQVRARMAAVNPKSRLWLGGESILVENAIAGLVSRGQLRWPGAEGDHR